MQVFRADDPLRDQETGAGSCPAARPAGQERPRGGNGPRKEELGLRQFSIALAGRKIAARAFQNVCGRYCLTATGSDRSPTVNSASTTRLSRPIFTGRHAAAWTSPGGFAAMRARQRVRHGRVAPDGGSGSIDDDAVGRRHDCSLLPGGGVEGKGSLAENGEEGMGEGGG